MTDRINGYGRIGLDSTPTRARSVNRGGDEGRTESARRAPEADAVRLTGTAARLKSIEARLSDIPDVDEARVAALREKIDSGEYRPDATRIAGKLLRMERELG